MKLISYLFKKCMLPAYAAAAAVISLAFVLAAGGAAQMFLRMLPVVLLLLLTLRAADDFFDYEKDSAKKTQHLKKSGLIALACVCAAAFAALNVVFYGAKGLIILAAVGYIPLMEKLPPLKTAYMALLLLFYFWVEQTPPHWGRLAVIVGCFAASAAYHFIKRKVKK